jgi:hypothetical protein
MLLGLYFTATLIFVLVVGADYAWLPAFGTGALAFVSWLPGYSLVAALLYVPLPNKLGIIAAQAAFMAVLLWLESLAGTKVSIDDFEVSGQIWLITGVVIGGWNGLTTPPTTDEINEASR